MAADILGIRIQNIHSIIQALRFEERLTKRDIAAVTGLSFATVSNLCNELVERGVLRTTRDEALTVGRTPQTLTFRYNQFCVIAINLQLRGAMELAVLNFRNEVLTRRMYHIDELPAEQIVAFAYHRFLKDVKPELPPEAGFIGIGVAVSSIYDIHTGKLICCAIPQLENVDIKSLVEEAFGIPAYVDNEANLCAYAQKAIGKDSDNLVYIHASEGVGIGVITQGKLLRGANGYAGEVAHMPIGRGDHYCPNCGSYGCIERELCLDGLLTNFLGRAPEERFSSWQKFCQAFRSKESRALETAREAGHYLGVLACVLINLFDPGAVYVGGDIAALQEGMEPAMTQEIRQHCGAWRRVLPTISWDRDSELRINLGISEKICSTWTPG